MGDGSDYPEIRRIAARTAERCDARAVSGQPIGDEAARAAEVAEVARAAEVAEVARVAWTARAADVADVAEAAWAANAAWAARAEEAADRLTDALLTAIDAACTKREAT
jgi:hypothetical protein